MKNRPIEKSKPVISEGTIKIVISFSNDTFELPLILLQCIAISLNLIHTHTLLQHIQIQIQINVLNASQSNGYF